ncbi:unnamed protein product, partial [Ectocarpus sp. 12 AP-2014]
MLTTEVQWFYLDFQMALYFSCICRTPYADGTDLGGRGTRGLRYEFRFPPFGLVVANYSWFWPLALLLSPPFSSSSPLMPPLRSDKCGQKQLPGLQRNKQRQRARKR